MTSLLSIITGSPPFSDIFIEGDSNSRIWPVFAKPMRKLQFNTAMSKYCSGVAGLQAENRIEKNNTTGKIFFFICLFERKVTMALAGREGPSGNRLL